MPAYICGAVRLIPLIESSYCGNSAGGVDIEDEIRYRDDIKARRQATEVMATKPLPTL